jgi:hypothetical protein
MRVHDRTRLAQAAACVLGLLIVAGQVAAHVGDRDRVPLHASLVVATDKASSKA